MPNDPKCHQLFNYFKKEWVKKHGAEKWNHFDSKLRTNNKIEGFHSAFNNKIRIKHPNLFLFINCIKQQQGISLVDYQRLKQGQSIREQSKKEKELRFELLKIEFMRKENKISFEDSDESENEIVLPEIDLDLTSDKGEINFLSNNCMILNQNNLAAGTNDCDKLCELIGQSAN
ncbi:unnamed protein product, partial [Brachionus calyciflorus]